MNRMTLILFLSLLSLWLYRAFYFSPSSIEGVYINNNTTPVFEGPDSKSDTLKIFSNNTFENISWGKGSYVIKDSRITFSYEDKYGKASYSTTLSRPFLQNNIRISLNSDLDYFYQNID